MNDRAADPAPADPSGAPAPRDAPADATTSSSTAAAGSSNEPRHAEGGVKDTIESIIIAFILAFIFRGFIVEAFVIPTGSMAPTLLGAHMRFHCPDCGYRFDVNYFSEGGEGDEINIPSTARGRVFSVYCPNCSFKIPRIDYDDPHNDATAPQIRYGDRILVLKYLYLISDPQRWDVVVFKSPNEPEKHDFAQNYIKRLVGLPGESVYILDGDVYVGKPNVPAEAYVVQSKPRHVQDALWRIVYDNDHLPRGVAGSKWAQPWKTRPNEKGWDTRGRDFTFDNSGGRATLFFDPSANPDHHALTDWLAYDQNNWNQLRGGDTYHAGSYEPDNNVSDVKLSFYYERTGGDGPLQLVLTKVDHAFTATLTATSASLVKHNTQTKQSQVIAENVPLPSASGGRRARHVEFTNVDYRVTLRIDGQDLIRSTPEHYRPDIPALLAAADTPDRRQPKPDILITAQDQTATLSHVELWRDVYYLNRSARMSGNTRPVHWASPHDFPDNVMVLEQDEYFVIGDNSPISGDARTWTTATDLPDENLYAKPGVVPGRFMIGKAFFVYWPAGYRPMETAPALVPNFGDMRFIH